jgi:hypothetical protein
MSESLERKRWMRNAFFTGGRTKNPRLDEIHNTLDATLVGKYDASDMDIAALILQRAGLSGHTKISSLTKVIAAGLSTIKDTDEFLNPDYHTTNVPEKLPAVRGLTTDVVEMKEKSDNESGAANNPKQPARKNAGTK